MTTSPERTARPSLDHHVAGLSLLGAAAMVEPGRLAGLLRSPLGIARSRRRWHR